MLARRLLLLAAVLMLLAALASGIAPREPAPPERPSASPEALRAGTTVERTIAAAPGADTHVTVRRGDLLKLEVTGELLDSVLLEGLDRLDAIEPETPARFEILVEAPAGAYPIRLVEADRRIGAIDVVR